MKWKGRAENEGKTEGQADEWHSQRSPEVFHSGPRRKATVRGRRSKADGSTFLFFFFLAFSFLFFAVFFLFIPTFLSIPRMVFIYLFSPSALALSFVIDYDDDGDDDDDDDDDDVDDDVVVASPERHHLLFLDEPEPFVAKHTPTQSDRKTKPK